ncbi:MAG: hypothetical protein ABI456_21960 [Ktedonobacteraceae bacterium]
MSITTPGPRETHIEEGAVAPKTRPTFQGWPLVGILIMLLVGCTTSPPDVSVHMTVTPTAFYWGALQQRPLHPPSLRRGTACPSMHGKQAIPGFSDFLAGNEPVYADFFGGYTSDRKQGVLIYADAQSFEGGVTNGWGGQKVLWFIDPAYHGPVLIRGERLDGPGQVRFDSEDGPDAPAVHTLLTALRLIGGGPASPWPNRSSYVRLQMPGCYAIQVDGLTFSKIFVFKALKR